MSGESIRVRVRCFAILRDLAFGERELELPARSRVDDAWDAVASAHPAVSPHRPYVRGALNGAYSAWDAELGEGDEVAFLPPVSGGATSALTAEAIDVRALEASVARTGHGALVTFVGRARDRSDDGRVVTELEYEAFDTMAETVLAEIAAEAEAAHGAAVAVVHRHGIVPVGEAAVAIVAAAPHRAEAYEANRFVIEQIKARLPVWKRERFTDGTEWKRPGA